MAGLGGIGLCRSFLIFGPSRSCAIVSTLRKKLAAVPLIGLKRNED